MSVYLIGLHTFGIPPSVTPEWYAALGNLLLFIPLTACAAIVWPKVRWWIWPVGVLVLSGTFEVVQSFIGREPSLGDVALNTGGALVGGRGGRDSPGPAYQRGGVRVARQGVCAGGARGCAQAAKGVVQVAKAGVGGGEGWCPGGEGT